MAVWAFEVRQQEVQPLAVGDLKLSILKVLKLKLAESVDTE